MKATVLISTLSCFGSFAVAHPSIGGVVEEIKQLTRRQFQPSTELLGDLKTLPNSALSTTGKAVKAILQGTANPIDTTSTYTAPAGGRDAQACRADRCCIWKYIANDMRAVFLQNGQCTNAARQAIRIGFHDAATWTKTTAIGQGGADGSLLLSNGAGNAKEMNRPENAAMAPTAAIFISWWNTYKNYGVTMADLIQFGAKVAAGSCPGGPRIRAFIGRVDNPNANPSGLLPGPGANASFIITMFGAKTIAPGGIVALLGAHTASRQTSVAGVSQDSTPGKWDLKYFTETVSSTPSNIVRFPSDINIANDPTTSPVWNQFKTNKAAWDKAYAGEYIRMSLMGFQDINGMVECTKALPSVVPL
ncbi:heme peroxidase [Podospora conica]|nr:heme peroxidase [Schizothecium conicum]